ncbi:hypothetical protein [Lutibacter flavus]|nr:hypothetical protein [Lutibacter flavus]
MNNKLPNLIELGINAKVWDMTNGITYTQLKKMDGTIVIWRIFLKTK